MGLFSGGFLGGGTDESSTANVTTNIVETTTTTQMRDVGLTGQNAVDLAAVNMGGLVGLNDGWGATIQKVNADVNATLSKGYTGLLDASKSIMKQVAGDQSGMFGQLMNVSAGLMNPSLDVAQGTQKTMIIIAIAAAAAFAVYAWKGKR